MVLLIQRTTIATADMVRQDAAIAIENGHIGQYRGSIAHHRNLKGLPQEPALSTGPSRGRNDPSRSRQATPT